MNKHNNPPLLVEMDASLARFVIENCDANISIGLNTLQMVMQGALSREAGEKTVALMENFKAVKKAVEKAQKDT